MMDKSKQMVLGLLMIAIGISVRAEVFPGMREYTQRITLEYATPVEAESAELTPLPLPDWCKLAFSARWDDSAPAHLKTHEVMADAGVKGTFFLNSGTAATGPEYCRKLLENGCSIGGHTLTHPFLSTVNPNEQFYEIMHLKALREADSDSPITTMVFPYCNYNSRYEKSVQYDIGHAMMNAGIIGAPTPYYGKLERELGYPTGTLAESGLLTPGDRDVSAELFYKQLKAYLADRTKLSGNPSVSIAIHSWHTPDGLATLKRLLREHSGSPDWWYCNQNEYAAYRFEANQTRITRQVEGRNAIFTVTRFAPDQLGADVPLWLALSGAKPGKVGGGLLKEAAGLMAVVLPHDPAERIFVRCAVAGQDGKSAKYPGLTGSLTVRDGRFAVVLDNGGGEALRNLRLTLRLPAGYTPGVIRRESGDIAPGERGEWQFDPGKRDDATRYRIGHPYFIAQLDFDRGGQRCRYYLPLRTAADPAPPPGIGNAARVFAPLPDSFDPKRLSTPGVDPKQEYGLEPLTLRDPDAGAENAIRFVLPGKSGRTASAVPVAALVEFVPAEAGDIAFAGNAKTLYWNGQPIERNKADGKWIVPAVAGVNRVVAMYECDYPGRLEGRFLLAEESKIRQFKR